MSRDKAHRYATRVEWTGNLGRGTADYRAYSRDHVITAPGRPELAGSSDPAFRGDATRWGHPLRASLVREQQDLARSVGGRVILLHVMPATEFMQWGGVQAAIEAEAAENAQALLAGIADEVVAWTGSRPGVIIAKGEAVAAVMDTVAADPTRSQPLTLEPVDFNGVLLGETTLDEVLQSWGQPLARGGDAATARLKYQIDPFAGVEVSFVGGKATAVVVDLGDQFSPADVAKELNIKLEDSVAVEDAAGNELGLVFPERGVSMRYEDGAAEPKVAYGAQRMSLPP